MLQKFTFASSISQSVVNCQLLTDNSCNSNKLGSTGFDSETELIVSM